VELQILEHRRNTACDSLTPTPGDSCRQGAWSVKGLACHSPLLKSLLTKSPQNIGRHAKGQKFKSLPHISAP